MGGSHVGASSARGEPPTGGSGRRRLSGTTCLLVLLLVVGAIGSALGARSWKDAVQTENQRAFDATATSVAGTLAASLKSYGDAVATEQTLIATDPTIDNATLSQWFTSIGSVHRFPASFGFAYIESVTPAELPAFVSTVTADPSLGMSFPFDSQLNPPGTRAQYCLMRLITLQIAPEVPIGPSQIPGMIRLFSNYVDPWNDECAGPEGVALQQSARGRQLTVTSFSDELAGIYHANPGARTTLDREFGGLAPIVIGLPVESIATTGSPSHLLGWAVSVVDANLLLEPILNVQRGMAFVLSAHGPNGAQVVTGVGHLGSGGPVKTFNLVGEGHWTLQLSGGPTGGLSPDAQGMLVFAGGLLVTLLLFLLARSRSFALELVDARTKELRHQAAHDALTDLPNRALILEETDRALARAQTSGTSVALLFIDLDGFKDVNDAHGHGVGDVLLQMVADRFAEMLGEDDSMGRLGGDEFIVFAEGSSAANPELLAGRLLASCEAPFHIDQLPGVP